MIGLVYFESAGEISCGMLASQYAKHPIFIQRRVTFRGNDIISFVLAHHIRQRLLGLLYSALPVAIA